MTREQTIFDGAHDDVFYLPGHDPGVYLLEKPDWFWRRRRGGTIRFLNMCQDEAGQAQYEKVNRQFFTSRFDHVVEFNSMPVVLENVSFFKQFMSVGGKWMLNGYAGERFSTAHYIHHHFDLGNKNFSHEHVEYMTTIGRGRSETPFAIWADSQGSIETLDYTIDCRNLFNYHHFLTETLAQLATVLQAPSTGRVRIHSSATILKDFALNAMQEVFPNHIDRIEIIDDVSEPVHYDRSIGALHMQKLYAHLSEMSVPDYSHYEDFPELWSMRTGHRSEIGKLMHNRCLAPIRHLRETAYQQLDKRDDSHLPKRFWVGRRATKSLRAREPEGTEQLVAELKRHGYEELFFEDLSQLEQAAAMRNAQSVVTVHGAGVANMSFASPQTHLYELSNGDCLGGRWKGFVSLAHSAECAYTNLFVDKAPTDHGLAPIAVRGDATDRILMQIDQDGLL